MGGAVNRGFVRFGFVYLSSGRTHTHKHSCSLVSCDPLIRARFGPTVGHINLQLQQQADASNLAMYTRVYAHIHIHTYVWAIYKHTHTRTFFPLISLCPLSVVLVRSSLAWIIFQCQKFVPPFEKLKSVLMATATATATALAMKINGLPLPVSSFPLDFPHKAPAAMQSLACCSSVPL